MNTIDDIHVKENVIFDPLSQLRQILSSTQSHNYLDISDNLIRQCKSAINLISFIPVSRIAALETISNCYAYAYLHTTLELQSINQLLNDIPLILFRLLNYNQVAWTPIIFAWGIKLLGNLNANTGNLQRSSLPQQINFWVNNKIIQPILNITLYCLDYYYSEDSEKCIQSLLETINNLDINLAWLVGIFCQTHSITSLPILLRLIHIYNNNEYFLAIIIECIDFLSMSTPHLVNKMVLSESIMNFVSENSSYDYFNLLIKLFWELLTRNSIILKIVIHELLPYLSIANIGRTLNFIRSDQLMSQTPIPIHYDLAKKSILNLIVSLKGKPAFDFLDLLLNIIYPEKSTENSNSKNYHSDDSNIEEGELVDDGQSGEFVSFKIIKSVISSLLIDFNDCARNHLLNINKNRSIISIEKERMFIYITELKKFIDSFKLKVNKQKIDSNQIHFIFSLFSLFGILGTYIDAIDILAFCIKYMILRDNILSHFINLHSKIQIIYPTIMKKVISFCLNSFRIDTANCITNQNFFQNMRYLIQTKIVSKWNHRPSIILDYLKYSCLILFYILEYTQIDCFHELIELISYFKSIPLTLSIVEKVQLSHRFISFAFKNLMLNSLNNLNECEILIESYLFHAFDHLKFLFSNNIEILSYSLRIIFNLSSYYNKANKTFSPKPKLTNLFDKLQDVSGNDYIFTEKNYKDSKLKQLQNYSLHRIFRRKLFQNHNSNHMLLLLCDYYSSFNSDSIIAVNFDNSAKLFFDRLSLLLLDTFALHDFQGSLKLEFIEEEFLKYSIEKHLSIIAEVESNCFYLDVLLILANNGISLLYCFHIIVAIISYLSDKSTIEYPERSSEIFHDSLALCLIRILCNAQWIIPEMLSLTEILHLFPKSELCYIFKEVYSFIYQFPPFVHLFQMSETGLLRIFDCYSRRKLLSFLNIVIVRNIENIGHLTTSVFH